MPRADQPVRGRLPRRRHGQVDRFLQVGSRIQVGRRVCSRAAQARGLLFVEGYDLADGRQPGRNPRRKADHALARPESRPGGPPVFATLPEGIGLPGRGAFGAGDPLLADRHEASGGVGRRHRKVPGASRPRASGMMAPTRVAGKAKEAAMADSKKKEDFGTRVFNAATMMAASFVARKAITLVWTKVTGKKPPVNPEDPGVALVEALTWSVLTGVTVA